LQIIERPGESKPVGRKSRIQAVARRTWRERELWLISIPMLIWAGIFCYYPIYGVIVAFYNYIPGRPILQNRWVGLQYFQEFFTNPEFGMVMRNTLAISGLNILFAFPAPIVLAVLINELRNGWFKRVTQTVSYMPHFVSWVVTASLLFTLLGNEGLINELLRSVGLTRQAVPFLTRGQYFWGIITVANIWKGVGWASIIYLSAIAGIDEELYQAGAVDGLGRFGMIWHITLPGILTTVVVLFILDIGGILNAGFEQQLLIGNAQTRNYYEVIDTYAYRYGIQLGRYSFGTAIGLMKSLVGLGLVLATNRVSRKRLEISIL
jgi:putative aldouronate transport system permease protein